MSSPRRDHVSTAYEIWCDRSDEAAEFAWMVQCSPWAKGLQSQIRSSAAAWAAWLAESCNSNATQ